MGKIVNVRGFLTEVSAMKVRYLFERITGSKTIHTIGLKETNHIDVWPSEGLNPLSQNEGWKKPYRNAVNAILERYGQTKIQKCDVAWMIRNHTDQPVFHSRDGIRKISSELAEMVARKCDIKGIFPSIFHIRCGGYKGVVAQNPNSSKKLSLGSRMKTFYSDHTKLDALAWTKEQHCFLNRQMISILSTLGISDNVLRKNLRKLLIR
ncbi:hypothetical protein IGI04_003673 [Brassica rapa subsp. trilocularis]|uniref:RNA-dependent RNA polymerase n=1 Tax=Brassica rapa subsp. trilocularis TaxID=1813537 RepID=A0ABQ7P148_BRACM|nr:hypothetical protein IGI04_003673 [Brassica rapa subsp. trilocularis]